VQAVCALRVRALGGSRSACLEKSRMTKIKKLGHVVLFVSDPKISARWYGDVLGIELVVFDEHMPAAFLSFNERDHDIALFKTPDDRALGHRDVEHLAFEIDGDLQDFKRFRQRLVGNSTKVLGVIDHGISCGT
jgi:catechol 2,3-dioxygenase